MGFLDNNSTSSLSSDKLDLVEFESAFVKKFNDPHILDTKYMAEEFGLSFDKHKRQSDVYYFEGETITICPEPLEFIKEFDDVSDNTSKANELFQRKIETFQRITLDSEPELKGSRMWMNKTLTGINLRPGNLNDDRDKFDPIRMCDDNVHGLIAGRTGSGKSVFINALILSLITEYSPWELNLYLADFKKVELSRYMNNADEANGNTPFTPHVNACAATSEIRYVTSLIKYLVDCMNARQEFFARLGVTKISEFRNKYRLVLPRVLLIVDEFQQLFIEATNREAEEIQTMLNSITKLGRATGFHLVFASQEMSGTLRSNTLANFKIRMCLPCTQQISTDILGNSQAVNLKRGYVLINTDSGDELKNQKFRVPFIETDKKDNDDDNSKTAFYKFLDEIKLAAKQYDLKYKTSVQKFYREELQETEIAYRSDLDKIKDRKNELVAKNRSLFDAIVLGKTVMYSPQPNDKVSFYIEKGRNKGIMVACPEPDNAARVRKLITENLIRSSDKTYHFGMELNNLVLEKYHIAKAVSNTGIHEYCQCGIDNAIEKLGLMYYLRTFAKKYFDAKSGEFSKIQQDEKAFTLILQDNSKVEEHKRKLEQQRVLSERLKDVDAQISALSENNKMTLLSPIIAYLEKCSADIVLIEADKTKALFTSLSAYKDVKEAFSQNPDLVSASKKGIRILDARIEALAKGDAAALAKEAKANPINLNFPEARIAQYKIFRRAILFFVDKYEGKEPEKTSISPALEETYSAFESAVNEYKKSYESKKPLLEKSNKLLDEQQDISDQLEAVEKSLSEFESAKEKASAHLKDYLSQVFDSCNTISGLKKFCPLTADVEYSFENGQIKWEVTKVEDKIIKIIVSDLLDVFIQRFRTEDNSVDFKKVVFWINGLDEIEKIPNLFEEVVSNSINQNILVIGIITSELRDTLLRKAFDYAFITGNIEKFYSMFNIKYTKQPLDSIVVNFGIRSKGFDIPFKMYKSNLEEIPAPDFIDHLLNA